MKRVFITTGHTPNVCIVLLSSVMSLLGEHASVGKDSDTIATDRKQNVGEKERAEIVMILRFVAQQLELQSGLSDVPDLRKFNTKRMSDSTNGFADSGIRKTPCFDGNLIHFRPCREITEDTHV